VPTTLDSAGGGERQRGWEPAQWAVANSSALHIEHVSYAGREWTAGETGQEWRTAPKPSNSMKQMKQMKQVKPATTAAVDEVRIATGQ
jgi:hypothetical protein